MCRFCFTFFIVFNLEIQALIAAESGHTSFDSCLQSAFNANPQIKSAQKALGSAELQKEKAEATFFPTSQAYLRSDITRTSNISRSSQLGSTADPDFSRSHAYGLEVKQNLFKGGGDQANLNMSSINQDIVSLELESLRISLAYQVRSTFIDLLYNQELIKLNQVLLKRREENHKMVTLRHASGHENKGSVLRSAALLSESRADLTLAENGLFLARRKMSSLTLNFNTDKNILAEGTLQDFIISPEINENDVLDNLGEIKIFAQKISEAEAELKFVASSSYPKLDLSLGANRSNDTWPPHTLRLYAGLSLQYDLDFFGLQKRDRQIAQLKIEKLHEDYANLKNTRLLAIQVAEYKLKEAEINTAVTAEHLKASETQVHIARTSYNLGLKSFQEWDQLENDLVYKRKQYLMNVKERAQRSADLLNETGRVR